MPYDEPFNYSGFLGFSYREGEKLIPIDHLPIGGQVRLLEDHAGRMVVTHPYDPFVPYRVELLLLQDRGVPVEPASMSLVESDPLGGYRARTMARLADGQEIVGRAGTRPYSFTAAPASDLAGQLSVVEAVERLRSVVSSG